MKKLLLSIVLIASLSLTVPAKAEQLVFAKTIQQACLRPAPTLSAQCFYNVPAGEMSDLLSGEVNRFYRVRYTDAGGNVYTGWIYKTRVILIYRDPQPKR